MTVKQILKGTAFKCIVVLLGIVLVSGIFLTLCNSIFYVSDSEVLQRAITKIYGTEMEVEELEVSGGSYDTATILKVYKDADGNYLVQSKGTGGFGGTVTCWVLITVSSGSVTGVGSVSVKESDGETMLASINYLDTFADAEYYDGFTFTTDNGYMTASATKSSTAIDNAVNGAVTYVASIL